MAKQQLTLIELSRLAGLTDGRQRSLIYYPGRLPSLETCVWLAMATGYPASTFLNLEGMVEATGVDSLDPQRVNLLRLYDWLRANKPDCRHPGYQPGSRASLESVLSIAGKP